jgi:hypothetical protein
MHMQWTFEFDEPRGYVRIVTRGDFTLADNRRMVEELLSRPEWRPGTATLFDHRQLSLDGIGFEEMLDVKSVHVDNDARIGNGKSANLMKSDTDYGVGRQFEILTHGRVSAKVRAFRNEQEAVAWLLGGERIPG